MRRLSTVLALVIATVVLANRAVAAENWPQFRGPTGLGYTAEKDLPTVWGGSDNQNVVWKSPLVGEGHASPIVWNDLVFLSTVIWPKSPEEQKKAIPEHHVLCYRAGDGKLLWDRTVKPGPWLRSDFRSGAGGGYASPTPATDGRLVYCAFGSSLLGAWDFEGNLVWRNEIEPHNFDVTLGSSPVLYDDSVILLCAMAEAKDSRLVAFRKASGETKWEQKLPKTGFGHCTPVILTAAGRTQLVFAASAMVITPEALQSFDPATGNRLWWCRGSGGAASVAFDGKSLIFSDGGRGGTGGQGLLVEATGEGDVSEKVRWTAKTPEGIGSPVIVDGRVYHLQNPGVLKCWNLADGKELYTARLEGITSTWASPVADPNGRIYFATAGRSAVVQAGPEFKLLATNDLGDANHNSPAVAGGRMFLVGMKNIYCIGKK